MTPPLDGFREWCRHVEIPSRDEGEGPIPMWPLFGTQEYLLTEIERGMAEGIHDFVVLKGGRQIGGTTLFDALALWYLQSHPGLIGMYVSDDDDNREYRRDVLLGMLDSLPKAQRQGVRLNNKGILAWRNNPKTGYRGSRLVFGAAGKRTGGNLGRSKGLSFNINDEVGSWPDQKAYAALRASRSKRNPKRFYADVSTARGIGTVFHKAWRTAQKAVARRAIFVAWWRHAGYRVEQGTPLFARYGEGPPARQEIEWMVEVRKRYGVTIEPEQLAWHRWQLAEEFDGDEVLMSQEFGSLPEECFQAFGDKFVSPLVVKKLQREAEEAEPSGYTYEWGKFIEHSEVLPCDPADAMLTVWEEPEPDGVYIVAAHAWGSSSPRAKENVCHVYRAWPDRLRLVAEFAGGAEVKTYQLAWVCLHLCGAYHTRAPIWRPPYFIFDVSMGGQHLLSELQLIESLGFGTAPTAISERSKIVNMMGAIHYLYRRLDTFTSSVAREIKIGGSTETRARVLYALRDHLERDHLEIYSAPTIDQLAMLRQGEDSDADTIAGGGDTEESRALTAAMAVEAWRSQAMGDLVVLVAPREQEGSTQRVENVMVADYLAMVRRMGSAQE